MSTASSSQPLKASAKKTYPFWTGGAAAAMAACCTHPLDLVRVRMQTATVKASMVQTAISTVKTNGITGIYAGLTASVFRQFTYSMARFGAYESLKTYMSQNGKKQLSGLEMIGCASMAGLLGGIAGNPADIILVRMTTDTVKPLEQRYNYKHALDGLWRVTTDEGVGALFRGLGPNLVRAVLMNSSQLVSYDWFKMGLMNTFDFKDGLLLHSLASLGAGTVATTICSPADVVRSRVMNAKGPGSDPITVITRSLKNEGPQFLFKGWTPAWIRLAPNTVLIFIFLEQLRGVIDKTRALV